MTFHQKIFALLVSIALLLAILEMVRRRKVKEEYSWLWLFVGAMMVALVLWPRVLSFFTNLIGAEDPLTTVFLFGFFLVLLVNVDYSIRISTYKEQIKRLAQKTGILSKEVEDLRKQK